MRTLLQNAFVQRQYMPFSARMLSTLSDINPSATIIKRTTTPKTKLPNEKLLFGNSYTDHMLEIDWDNKNGWHTPIISPYHSLSIDPASSSLHYALQLFEGMKAYTTAKGSIRLFRPEKNMERMAQSAKRLHFPEFNQKALLETIKQLIQVERSWIPKGDGFSLYIRPTIISTHPFLGVGPAKYVKFFAILSPVGPYYPEGFNAISLYADSVNVRAWPGGAGAFKLGANYGPTIAPAMEATSKGFTQILWLLGEEEVVTEVGTMNQFFFWITPEGKKELITAPLDGTILPGVTRSCILELCREWGEFEVTERPYTMKEVAAAVKEGRMIESFGAGTAAVVAPVKGIHWKGEDLKIPLDPSDNSSQAGKLTKRLATTIMDIQYGKVDHPWSHVVE